MPYETTTYRREELYEQIWGKPMLEVAKKYGVSDVALAKVCRKLNVPRPSRGYWARKAAGQKVSRVPLPPLKPNEVAEYQVSKWKSPPPTEPSAEEVAFRARFAPQRVDLPFMVEVKATLDRPHRMVAATLKALRKATPDRDGLCSPYGEDCLPIKISKEQGDRAGRFLDALLKAVEKAGHEVRSAEGYASPRRFIVDGEEIEFSMKERLIGAKHVLTPEERKYPSLAPKRDFRPSGDLRFRIVTDRDYGHSQQWEESRSCTLEAQIENIFLSLLQAAPDKKAREAERVERERLRREEEQRRWQVEMRQREEQQRAEALVEQAQQWQRVQVLRHFIEAVRAESVARFGEIQPGSSPEAWLTYASGVANRLDPLTALFVPTDEQ